VEHALRAVGLLAVLLVAVPSRAAPGGLSGPWPPDPAGYAPVGSPVAPGLAVGDVLGPANAARAAGLLPPEVLRHYEAGDYRNAIASWPDGIVRRSAAFDAASAANVGRYELDPETGTIVEAETGEPAENLYGLPFRDIAPGDPEGGLKAVWNQFHSYWNAGSHHIHSTVVWARVRGLERQATLESFFQFYDNQEAAYRIPDPGRFAVQSLVLVKSPADLQGTVSLSYRYRDPRRQDALWTYVPALRRVRVVSASTVPSPATGPAGVAPEWVTNDPTPWRCMEAVPFARATLSGLNTDASAPRAFRARLPVEELFDLQALARLGR
jgi:hypothetical protein